MHILFTKTMLSWVDPWLLRECFILRHVHVFWFACIFMFNSIQSDWEAGDVFARGCVTVMKTECFLKGTKTGVSAIACFYSWYIWDITLLEIGGKNHAFIKRLWIFNYLIYSFVYFCTMLNRCVLSSENRKMSILCPGSKLFGDWTKVFTISKIVNALLGI